MGRVASDPIDNLAEKPRRVEWRTHRQEPSAHTLMRILVWPALRANALPQMLLELSYGRGEARDHLRQ